MSILLDSKSGVRKDMRVQVPPPILLSRQRVTTTAPGSLGVQRIRPRDSIRQPPPDSAQRRLLGNALRSSSAEDRHLAGGRVARLQPKAPTDEQLDVHDVGPQAGGCQTGFLVRRLLANVLDRPRPRRGPLFGQHGDALGPGGLGLQLGPGAGSKPQACRPTDARIGRRAHAGGWFPGLL